MSATRTDIAASDRSRHTAARGFTLLEVLLAVTLTLGLVAMLLAFNRRATSTRARLFEQMDAISAERLVMDRVTNELRGAMRYPFIQFGLEGGPEQITFLTAALPGPAVWAVPKATDDPIPPEHDLRIVGYRLRVEENEEGIEEVAGLERTCQKIVAARTAEEGKEIAVALLTDRIRFLRLRYWDGSAWAESWTGGQLPQAVEIAMARQPLPEGAGEDEYPQSAFRRVIYLPGSVASQQRAESGRTGGGT